MIISQILIIQYIEIGHGQLCCDGGHIAICMTGFWKTDRTVMLSIVYFIGPANGYTCALHIHSGITRLSQLVCFSRASFTTI